MIVWILTAIVNDSRVQNIGCFSTEEKCIEVKNKWEEICRNAHFSIEIFYDKTEMDIDDPKSFLNEKEFNNIKNELRDYNLKKII